jgi:hypothetical protein
MRRAPRVPLRCGRWGKPLRQKTPSPFFLVNYLREAGWSLSLTPSPATVRTDSVALEHLYTPAHGKSTSRKVLQPLWCELCRWMFCTRHRLAEPGLRSAVPQRPRYRVRGPRIPRPTGAARAIAEHESCWQDERQRAHGVVLPLAEDRGALRKDIQRRPGASKYFEQLHRLLQPTAIAFVAALPTAGCLRAKGGRVILCQLMRRKFQAFGRR